MHDQKLLGAKSTNLKLDIGDVLALMEILFIITKSTHSNFFISLLDAINKTSKSSYTQLLQRYLKNSTPTNGANSKSHSPPTDDTCTAPKKKRGRPPKSQSTPTDDTCTAPIPESSSGTTTQKRSRPKKKSVKMK
ncbi:hypothetical protein PPL_06715 [Heterostelium album PN500]|uniref:Uncharacterized protein n=1 Tax=Heterostelium pallidum (strain ATCC 26659 / Pp 5 / PN500) TaxID=670386 RepID=D3BFI1_HETP5|nr:hypothetical protein PPL_06715 [Heterostelium album PN500]EFA79895.1 hypothetical protein PPL_06715 [Heterostelium album PN500]|eukprot:XP_020432016.1 hypothetical protein PPL_06715 [Heterostelium album PN500]